MKILFFNLDDVYGENLFRVAVSAKENYFV
jgi:hypothetical protein